MKQHHSLSYDKHIYALLNIYAKPCYFEHNEAWTKYPAFSVDSIINYMSMTEIMYMD